MQRIPWQKVMHTQAQYIYDTLLIMMLLLKKSCDSGPVGYNYWNVGLSLKLRYYIFDLGYTFS